MARLAVLTEGQQGSWYRARPASSCWQPRQNSLVLLAKVSPQLDAQILLQLLVHEYAAACVHLGIVAVSCYRLISMSLPDKPVKCRAAAIKGARGRGAAGGGGGYSGQGNEPGGPVRGRVHL